MDSRVTHNSSNSWHNILLESWVSHELSNLSSEGVQSIHEHHEIISVNCHSDILSNLASGLDLDGLGSSEEADEGGEFHAEKDFD